MGGFAIMFSQAANTTTDRRVHHTDEIELQDWPGPDLEKSISAPASLPVEYLRHHPLDSPTNWDAKETHHAQLEMIRGLLVSDRMKHILSPELSVQPSRVIGEIGWQVDHTNAALVDLALKTIDMRHFQNQSEFARFSDMHIAWAYNIALLKGDLWVVDASQLLMARDLGIIDRLPYLPSDDLGDRNKQDLFLKALVMGQITWFIIEISARYHQRLSTSLLEVMVLAFAICTIITYCLLLDKPNNATYTITIQAARHPRSAPEMTRLALVGPAASAFARRSIWIPNNAGHLDYHLDGANTQRALLFTACASAAAVVVFGGVHCIGWEFKFPTHAEKLMWHASSVITAVAFPAGVLFIFSWIPVNPRVYFGTVFVLFNVPFVVARVFILVEVFRSLAFLPPDAFMTTWASEIPHG
ncbi:hypothetical protein PGQ11_005531 [Apiospora arundinis]|uniref:Uncharacterized protein n=1 Tax=Apiospora arundinis TaxID=335852 RepID=A0ABR2JCC6_9PEZI